MTGNSVLKFPRAIKRTYVSKLMCTALSHDYDISVLLCVAQIKLKDKKLGGLEHKNGCFRSNFKYFDVYQCR